MATKLNLWTSRGQTHEIIDDHDDHRILEARCTMRFSFIPAKTRERQSPVLDCDRCIEVRRELELPEVCDVCGEVWPDPHKPGCPSYQEPPMPVRTTIEFSYDELAALHGVLDHPHDDPALERARDKIIAAASIKFEVKNSPTITGLADAARQRVPVSSIDNSQPAFRSQQADKRKCGHQFSGPDNQMVVCDMQPNHGGNSHAGILPSTGYLVWEHMVKSAIKTSHGDIPIIADPTMAPGTFEFKTETKADKISRIIGEQDAKFLKELLRDIPWGAVNDQLVVHRSTTNADIMAWVKRAWQLREALHMPLNAEMVGKTDAIDPGGATLAWQLSEHVHRWVLREAPRLKDETWSAELKIALMNPQYEDDDTLFLETDIQETTTIRDVSGPVPEVKR